MPRRLPNTSCQPFSRYLPCVWRFCCYLRVAPYTNSSVLLLSMLPHNCLLLYVPLFLVSLTLCLFGSLLLLLLRCCPRYPATPWARSISASWSPRAFQSRSLLVAMARKLPRHRARPHPRERLPSRSGCLDLGRYTPVMLLSRRSRRTRKAASASSNPPPWSAFTPQDIRLGPVPSPRMLVPVRHTCGWWDVGAAI